MRQKVCLAVGFAALMLNGCGQTQASRATGNQSQSKPEESINAISQQNFDKIEQLGACADANVMMIQIMRSENPLLKEIFNSSTDEEQKYMDARAEDAALSFMTAMELKNEYQIPYKQFEEKMMIWHDNFQNEKNKLGFKDAVIKIMDKTEGCISLFSDEERRKQKSDHQSEFENLYEKAISGSFSN